MKIKLKPMDHMYDRRGRHLFNTITQLPVFVTEEITIDVDDDVAEATLKYIESNRNNLNSYIVPRQIINIPEKLPEETENSSNSTDSTKNP